MKSFFRHLERAGARAEDALLVLILTSMILLASAQILGRNFLGFSIPHADGWLRIMLLWLTLAGAMAASRADRHISIVLLDRILPERLHNAAHIFTQSFTSGICGLLAWHSYRFVRDAREYGDVLLGDTPAWLLQSIIPIGFALMAWRHALAALKLAVASLRGDSG